MGLDAGRTWPHMAEETDEGSEKSSNAGKEWKSRCGWGGETVMGGGGTAVGWI